MSAARFLTMPFGDLRRRLDQSLIYDWAMRLPIMVYCSFLLYGDVAGFCRQLLAHPEALYRLDVGTIVAVLARISQWMFVILLAIQPLFRLRAVGKSEQVVPRLVALVAVCVPLAFLQLERAPASIGFNMASIFISLPANVMCVVTASFLGRSLSVMPEARRLVQDGPYGVVRHPLYLCELLAAFGVALQYRSAATAALLFVEFGLQVVRARYEEGVLSCSFPDFDAYRAQTSFLFPKDPVHFLASFLTNGTVRRRSATAVAIMAALLAFVFVLPRMFV
jgi:protein-S-isoprenylcysteine O-methyltransferase Ste14